MSEKTAMQNQMEALSRRLEGDAQFANVLASLDEALSVVEEDKPRSRLKVPYANAVPIDSDADWN
jgi:hypothetical protein